MSEGQQSGLLDTMDLQLDSPPSDVSADSSPSEPDPAHPETRDGIEIEEEIAPSDQITDPFNPEQIKIFTKYLLVEQLVKRLQEHEINLAPDFQRNLIWESLEKARLVESLLLKIPIPVFYVASNHDDDWDVVDGIQRMSTIHDYVEGRFALKGLEYLTSLDGLTFDALPRRMQRRILETELLVNVIEHGTPPEVMFNVFTRINTGGAPLNAQEIRHALYRGAARDFLKKLAESPEFVKATDGSIRSKRMEDRECVLRFLAFHMDPWEQYSTSNLDAYLRRAMERINGMSDKDRQSLAEDFFRAMRAARDLFGNRAFRKVYEGDAGRRPINRALFETWSVELAQCSPAGLGALVTRREELLGAFVFHLSTDRDFERAISVGTGDRRRVKTRFRAVRSLVRQFSR